jgi:hypothetical protein
MKSFKRLILGILLLGLCITPHVYSLNKDPHQLGTVVSGGGGGDVTSIESSSIDNSLVRMNSTTGKSIQKSDAILDDSENLTGLNTIRTKVYPVYNVLEWGLVGNGSTDNSTAYATMCAAVVAAGGGTIYFPAGDYHINTATYNFNLAANIHILGENQLTTIVDFSGILPLGDDGFKHLGPGGSVKNITVKTVINCMGVYAYGGSSNPPTDPVCGFTVENVRVLEGRFHLLGTGLNVKHIEAYQTPGGYAGYGVYINGIHPTIDDVLVRYYATGFFIDCFDGFIKSITSQFNLTADIELNLIESSIFMYLKAQYGAGIKYNGASFTNRDNLAIGITSYNNTPVSGTPYDSFSTIIGLYDNATDRYTNYIENHRVINTRTNASLKTAISVANEVRTDFISHFANATRHTAGQQSTASLPAAATDITTLIALVTEELTLYAAHNADAILASGWAYHNAQNMAGHALVSAAAPTDLAGVIGKLTDLKAKYNAHEIETDCHTTGTVTANQVATDLNAYTVTAFDRIIAVPDTQYTFSVLIPTTEVIEGRTFNVVDESCACNTNNITIDYVDAAKKINNSTGGFVMNVNCQQGEVYSDGTNGFAR